MVVARPRIFSYLIDRKKLFQLFSLYFTLITGELTLCHTTATFNNPEKKGFENILGKGEIAGNQHFLLFPQCFLPFQAQISIFK